MSAATENLFCVSGTSPTSLSGAQLRTSTQVFTVPFVLPELLPEDIAEIRDNHLLLRWSREWRYNPMTDTDDWRASLPQVREPWAITDLYKVPDELSKSHSVDEDKEIIPDDDSKDKEIIPSAIGPHSPLLRDKYKATIIYDGLGRIVGKRRSVSPAWSLLRFRLMVAAAAKGLKDGDANKLLHFLTTVPSVKSPMVQKLLTEFGLSSDFFPAKLIRYERRAYRKQRRKEKKLKEERLLKEREAELAEQNRLLLASLPTGAKETYQPPCWTGEPRPVGARTEARFYVSRIPTYDEIRRLLEDFGYDRYAARSLCCASA